VRCVEKPGGPENACNFVIRLVYMGTSSREPASPVGNENFECGDVQKKHRKVIGGRKDFVLGGSPTFRKEKGAVMGGNVQTQKGVPSTKRSGGISTGEPRAGGERKEGDKVRRWVEKKERGKIADTGYMAWPGTVWKTKTNASQNRGVGAT